jgi:hypothetical protein
LKKEAKTFAYWGARWVRRARQFSRVFGSFCKKELLAFA